MESFSELWKKLENVLLQLEHSTKIWLLKKFVEDAEKSITGANSYQIFTLYVLCYSIKKDEKRRGNYHGKIC